MINFNPAELVSFNVPVRFRPFFDLSNQFMWSTFGSKYYLHHLFRILIKTVSFIFILKIGRQIIPFDSKKNDCLSLLFAFSLYFFFPNSPEARLAPQELYSAFWMYTMIYFSFKANINLKYSLLLLFSFVFFLLSKESNIVQGGPFLAYVFYRLYNTRHRYLLVFFTLIFLHIFVKIYLMSKNGGYGNKELNLTLVLTNFKYLITYLLRPGAETDFFQLIFLIFVPIMVMYRNRRILLNFSNFRGQLINNHEITIITLSFLAACFTFLITWEPALRYAYLPVQLYILLLYIGFRALMKGPYFFALNYSHYFGLLFVLSVYPCLYYQFYIQNFSGRFERHLLKEVEQKVGNASLFIYDKNEFSHKVSVYYTSYRKKFFPKLKELSLSYQETHEKMEKHKYILTSNSHLIKNSNGPFVNHKISEIKSEDKFNYFFHSWIMALNKAMHIRSWFNPKLSYLWRDAGSSTPDQWYLIRNKNI